MSTTDDRSSQRRTYKEKQRSGTMGILLRGTKVLLLYRKLKTPEAPVNGDPDSWAFPGGGVDANETPEQAIVREFFEEVGLRVKIVSFRDEPVLGQVDDYLKHDFWRCSFFVVQQTDPSQEPKVCYGLRPTQKHN
ncbi:NUDIX hydrolase domain-like protein [Aspergillus keveii]|uniref:NUDIX hydrolase domain-like protein n=1 Tax=Aspergillus keveii TaxID=714993 RepID=A0ABR4FH01_9EURO